MSENSRYLTQRHRQIMRCFRQDMSKLRIFFCSLWTWMRSSKKPLTLLIWVSWNNRNEFWKKRKCCALVRAFTSHQFNLGLNPGSDAMSELNLFGSRPLLERFFFLLFNFNFFYQLRPSTPVSPPSPVLKILPNYNSIPIGRGRITLWMYYSSTIKSLHLFLSSLAFGPGKHVTVSHL